VQLVLAIAPLNFPDSHIAQLPSDVTPFPAAHWHLELPAVEANPAEQLMQLVAPATLEYVLLGQLLHCPFSPNLPVVHPMHVDDAISSENPVLHTHAVIFLTPGLNGNIELTGHEVHVYCAPLINKFFIAIPGA
jgi:hypothetical protein